MVIGGKRIGRGAGIVTVALLIAVLAFALGSIIGNRDYGVNEATVSTSDMGAPGAGGEAPLTYGDDAAIPEQDAARSADKSGAGTAGESLVIRNAGLEVRVDAVEDAIVSLRTAARRHNAEITELTVQSGSDGPRPLAEESAAFPSPATAYVTLRVPAERLDALQEDISKAGDVLSQTASSTDVTEQHIDLTARLRNLKAEESRLRSFFERATKVSDLLAIETELSRVRGEIEAMQAQIDYLDRQVARATLTVTLSEADPVVRPGAQWDFLDAVTRGVRAALTIIATMITGLIAVLPLLVIAAVIWLIVRRVRRRRARELDWGHTEPQKDADETET